MLTNDYQRKELRTLQKYDVNSVRHEIEMHKKNCGMQARLEAQQRREGADMPASALVQLARIKEKNSMVESWLSMLSEDEEYVIRRHLIDGLTWPRIETEYAERWKEFAKTGRTLMRYQNNALLKISSFMEEQM